jgi:hypothetical protein
LWECARRADDPGYKWWELPKIRWSLVQSGLLLVIVVLGFASLYLRSSAIADQITSAPTADAATAAAAVSQRVYLSTRLDAIYFAFMTLATQEFGDYVPTDGWTRFLVSWELLTTILLVFLILPLVLSKVGSYTVGPNAPPSVPPNLERIVENSVTRALDAREKRQPTDAVADVSAHKEKAVPTTPKVGG